MNDLELDDMLEGLDGLRALPMWQPWATLVVALEKLAETRGYPPSRLGLKEGEWIAIHAAKTEKALGMCGEEPFASAIRRAGFVSADQLPRGGIIGLTKIFEAREMDEEFIEHVRRDHGNEADFGDWQPGRWAWHLEAPVLLPSPIAVRGHQGAFKVPPEAIERLKVALRSLRSESP